MNVCECGCARIVYEIGSVLLKKRIDTLHINVYFPGLTDIYVHQPGSSLAQNPSIDLHGLRYPFAETHVEISTVYQWLGPVPRYCETSPLFILCPSPVDIVIIAKLLESIRSVDETVIHV